jgi:hypothetical protein
MGADRYQVKDGSGTRGDLLQRLWKASHGPCEAVRGDVSDRPEWHIGML